MADTLENLIKDINSLVKNYGKSNKKGNVVIENDKNFIDRINGLSQLVGYNWLSHMCKNKPEEFWALYFQNAGDLSKVRDACAKTWFATDPFSNYSDMYEWYINIAPDLLDAIIPNFLKLKHIFRGSGLRSAPARLKSFIEKCGLMTVGLPENMQFTTLVPQALGLSAGRFGVFLKPNSGGVGWVLTNLQDSAVQWEDSLDADVFLLIKDCSNLTYLLKFNPVAKNGGVQSAIVFGSAAAAPGPGKKLRPYIKIKNFNNWSPLRGSRMIDWGSGIS